MGGRLAIIREPGTESRVAGAEGLRGESQLSGDFTGRREQILQEYVPAALDGRVDLEAARL